MLLYAFAFCASSSMLTSTYKCWWLHSLPPGSAKSLMMKTRFFLPMSGFAQTLVCLLFGAWCLAFTPHLPLLPDSFEWSRNSPLALSAACQLNPGAIFVLVGYNGGDHPSVQYGSECEGPLDNNLKCNRLTQEIIACKRTSLVFLDASENNDWKDEAEARRFGGSLHDLFSSLRTSLVRPFGSVLFSSVVWGRGAPQNLLRAAKDQFTKQRMAAPMLLSAFFDANDFENFDLTQKHFVLFIDFTRFLTRLDNASVWQVFEQWGSIPRSQLYVGWYITFDSDPSLGPAIEKFLHQNRLFMHRDSTFLGRHYRDFDLTEENLAKEPLKDRLMIARRVANNPVRTNFPRKESNIQSISPISRPVIASKSTPVMHQKGVSPKDTSPSKSSLSHAEDSKSARMLNGLPTHSSVQSKSSYDDARGVSSRKTGDSAVRFESSSGNARDVSSSKTGDSSSAKSSTSQATTKRPSHIQKIPPRKGSNKKGAEVHTITRSTERITFTRVEDPRGVSTGEPANGQPPKVQAQNLKPPSSLQDFLPTTSSDTTFQRRADHDIIDESPEQVVRLYPKPIDRSKSTVLYPSVPYSSRDESFARRASEDESEAGEPRTISQWSVLAKDSSWQPMSTDPTRNHYVKGVHSFSSAIDRSDSHKATLSRPFQYGVSPPRLPMRHDSRPGTTAADGGAHTGYALRFPHTKPPRVPGQAGGLWPSAGQTSGGWNSHGMPIPMRPDSRPINNQKPVLNLGVASAIFPGQAGIPKPSVRQTPGGWNSHVMPIPMRPDSRPINNRKPVLNLGVAGAILPGQAGSPRPSAGQILGGLNSHIMPIPLERPVPHPINNQKPVLNLGVASAIFPGQAGIPRPSAGQTSGALNSHVMPIPMQPDLHPINNQKPVLNLGVASAIFPGQAGSPRPSAGQTSGALNSHVMPIPMQPDLHQINNQKPVSNLGVASAIFPGQAGSPRPSAGQTSDGLNSDGMTDRSELPDIFIINGWSIDQDTGIAGPSLHDQSGGLWPSTGQTSGGWDSHVMPIPMRPDSRPINNRKPFPDLGVVGALLPGQASRPRPSAWPIPDRGDSQNTDTPIDRSDSYPISNRAPDPNLGVAGASLSSQMKPQIVHETSAVSFTKPTFMARPISSKPEMEANNQYDTAAVHPGSDSIKIAGRPQQTSIQISVDHTALASPSPLPSIEVKFPPAKTASKMLSQGAQIPPAEYHRPGVSPLEDDEKDEATALPGGNRLVITKDLEGGNGFTVQQHGSGKLSLSDPEVYNNIFQSNKYFKGSKLQSSSPYDTHSPLFVDIEGPSRIDAPPSMHGKDAYGEVHLPADIEGVRTSMPVTTSYADLREYVMLLDRIYKIMRDEPWAKEITGHPLGPIVRGPDGVPTSADVVLGYIEALKKLKKGDESAEYSGLHPNHRYTPEEAAFHKKYYHDLSASLLSSQSSLSGMSKSTESPLPNHQQKQIMDIPSISPLRDQLRTSAYVPGALVSTVTFPLDPALQSPQASSRIIFPGVSQNDLEQQPVVSVVPGISPSINDGYVGVYSGIEGALNRAENQFAASTITSPGLGADFESQRSHWADVAGKRADLDAVDYVDNAAIGQDNPREEVDMMDNEISAGNHHPLPEEDPKRFGGTNNASGFNKVVSHTVGSSSGSTANIGAHGNEHKDLAEFHGTGNYRIPYEDERVDEYDDIGANEISRTHPLTKTYQAPVNETPATKVSRDPSLHSGTSTTVERYVQNTNGVLVNGKWHHHVLASAPLLPTRTLSYGGGFIPMHSADSDGHSVYAQVFLEPYGVEDYENVGGGERNEIPRIPQQARIESIYAKGQDDRSVNQSLPPSSLKASIENHYFGGATRTDTTTATSQVMRNGPGASNGFSGPPRAHPTKAVNDYGIHVAPHHTSRVGPTVIVRPNLSLEISRQPSYHSALDVQSLLNQFGQKVVGEVFLEPIYLDRRMNGGPRTQTEVSFADSKVTPISHRPQQHSVARDAHDSRLSIAWTPILRPQVINVAHNTENVSPSKYTEFGRNDPDLSKLVDEYSPTKSDPSITSTLLEQSQAVEQPSWYTQPKPFELRPSWYTQPRPFELRQGRSPHHLAQVSSSRDGCHDSNEDGALLIVKPFPVITSIAKCSWQGLHDRFVRSDAKPLERKLDGRGVKAKEESAPSSLGGFVTGAPTVGRGVLDESVGRATLIASADVFGRRIDSQTISAVVNEYAPAISSTPESGVRFLEKGSFFASGIKPGMVKASISSSTTEARTQVVYPSGVPHELSITWDPNLGDEMEPDSKHRVFEADKDMSGLVRAYGPVTPSVSPGVASYRTSEVTYSPAVGHQRSKFAREDMTSLNPEEGPRFPRSHDVKAALHGSDESRDEKSPDGLKENPPRDTSGGRNTPVSGQPDRESALFEGSHASNYPPLVSAGYKRCMSAAESQSNVNSGTRISSTFVWIPTRLFLLVLMSALVFG